MDIVMKKLMLVNIGGAPKGGGEGEGERRVFFRSLSQPQPAIALSTCRTCQNISLTGMLRKWRGSWPNC